LASIVRRSALPSFFAAATSLAVSCVDAEHAFICSLYDVSASSSDLTFDCRCFDVFFFFFFCELLLLWFPPPEEVSTLTSREPSGSTISSSSSSESSSESSSYAYFDS